MLIQMDAISFAHLGVTVNNESDLTCRRIALIGICQLESLICRLEQTEFSLPITLDQPIVSTEHTEDNIWN